MKEIQYESCTSVDQIVIESSLSVVCCERSSSDCDNHQWMIIQLFIHVLFNLSSVKERLRF
ncbi:hypothetical protein HanRHA438_Chr03g0134611 [Helianthus annuus]|nr:hypothetical protein HanRHA438_Chr03g0134611 [Helianthus annuus]